MTIRSRNADLSPLKLLGRQNEAIRALTATAELLRQQVQALRRRIDSIEGIPLPGEALPPG